MELEKIKQKIMSSNPDRSEERIKLFQIICEKLDQGGEDSVKTYLNEVGGSIQKMADDLESRALGSCQATGSKSADQEGSL
jgi:hypothetical protein